MKIQHGSLVDTVIDYANVKFGVDLSIDSVAQQLRNISFSDTMTLIDHIKKENDDGFSDFIDMSAVNESGGTITPTQATGPYKANNNAIKQQTRNQIIGRGAPDTVVRGGTGQVAGGNKQPTGSANRAAPDLDGQQRQQNAQTAGQAAQQAQINAQEIERLKQLAMGKR